MLLAVCLYAYPDASADEIAMYIFENDGGIYSRGSISKRMKEIKMSRKAASTEACFELNYSGLNHPRLAFSRFVAGS
jgi:hypothetical protein